MSPSKIGIFFGTETGTTRLVAKKIHARLGEVLADKPLNVNRIAPAAMLAYDALILGTPSYGVAQIPGAAAGCLESNWEEFLAQLPADADRHRPFVGKRIAFFGLGAQERYAERFCSSLRLLHDRFVALGAETIGAWPLDGYRFEHSAAVVDGRFVGLVIDQRTQGQQTDARLDAWVAQVRPALVERLGLAA